VSDPTKKSVIEAKYE